MTPARQPRSALTTSSVDDSMSLATTPARVHISSSARSSAGRGRRSGRRSAYRASTLRITPRWWGTPAALAASAHAVTTSCDAMAGYSRGTYASGVPSLRTAPVAMTRSPIRMPGWPPPHVPTRRNVWTPSSPSSSTAMAMDGPPMPLEQVDTGVSPTRPVNVRYSRDQARSSAASRWRAIRAVRKGSPGTSTYWPTSPAARPTWYLRCAATAEKCIRPPARSVRDRQLLGLRLAEVLLQEALVRQQVVDALLPHG